MGAVYHAWDEELGVGVALKIVRPEIALDPQMARDLDVSAIKAEMDAKLAQVRAQAQAARERVQQQNQTARPAANNAAPGSGTPPAGGAT
jgi:hypothetical protein